jgi:large subunit ribosomal protein L10
VARPDKVAAVADVRDNLSSAAATLVTNYRGLSVTELAELRAELRKANARYRVAKNTLTTIAAREAGMEGLEDFLSGPTALVFCEDDPVGPAKALKAFAKDHPALEFKGGYLDGAVLDAEEALRLADLASREELLTRLAQLMHGALANTARLLNALPEKQARLLQALVDAGGAPGAPADGASTEEAATDDAAEAASDDDVPAAEEATVAAPAGEDPVAEANEADAEQTEDASDDES